MNVLITGPCGSGKTTIIKKLRDLGYQTSAELEKELWFESEEKDFEKSIIDKRIKIFDRLKNKGLVFFDRGVIDPLVYRKYENKEVPEEFKDITKKSKYDIVFVVEPLDEHAPNPERDHLIKSSEDAWKWFKIMLETLKEYDYSPIIVKNMPLQERVDFILEYAKTSSRGNNG